jgi:3-oxoacyl-[acyl-carrier-protein] synthase-1
VLEPAAPDTDPDAILLVGTGESSDAYHMSSPHPEGLGAELAMRAALTDAGLSPGDIDYINAHGTGTPANDSAESLAMVRVFGREVPVSSTKGATGHALGAAGALEAMISILALRAGLVPGSVQTRTLDPGVGVNYRLRGEARRLKRVLTNSFGFGGTNATLVFARAGV